MLKMQINKNWPRCGKNKCDRLSHANMLKDGLEKKTTIDNLFSY